MSIGIPKELTRGLSFYFDFNYYTCFSKPEPNESLFYTGLVYILLDWKIEGWEDVFESKGFRSNGLLSYGFGFNSFWEALLRSLNKEFLGTEFWVVLGCEKGELDCFYPNKLGRLFVMVFMSNWLVPVKDGFWEFESTFY